MRITTLIKTIYNYIHLKTSTYINTRKEYVKPTNLSSIPVIMAPLLDENAIKKTLISEALIPNDLIMKEVYNRLLKDYLQQLYYDFDQQYSLEIEKLNHFSTKEKKSKQYAMLQKSIELLLSDKQKISTMLEKHASVNEDIFLLLHSKLQLQTKTNTLNKS